MYAAQGGHISSVAALLEAKANIDAADKVTIVCKIACHLKGSYYDNYGILFTNIL